MLSKFSVKKPYTVIVSVVMCLLLGVISFTNSTVDLLPEINLPYVVIYTPYPGASSQGVENNLTKLIENSVATVENLVTMSSTSSDNVSTVVLQFEDDTNMDKAIIDINSAIDMVEGYFDDMIQTPIIMAIDPNMLPVVMATLSYEGKDIYELSEFVDKEIQVELEKISGVASVDTTGLLTKTVEIRLDQDAIDKVNNDLLNKIDSELYDAEKEINDGLKEVNDGLSEVNKGIEELKTNKDKTINDLNTTSLMLQETATTFISMNSIINQLKAEEMTYTSIIDAIDKIKIVMKNPNATTDEVKVFLNNEITNLTNNITLLETLITNLNNFNASLATTIDTDTLVDPDLSYANTLLNPMVFTNTNTYLELKSAISNTITTQTNNIALANKAIEGYKQVLPLCDTYDTAVSRLDEIAIELKTAQTSYDMASKILTDNGINVANINNLQKEIENGKLLATGELTKAEIQLLDTKQTLEKAKEELEKAKEEMLEAKKDAFKEANLDGVLNAETISGILQAQNFSMPSGYIGNNNETILVKVGDSFATIEELKSLLIVPLEEQDLNNVYLGDISEVIIADNSDTIFTKVNGEDGISFSFSKTSLASTTDVSKDILKTFSELEEKYPDLKFTTLMDQGIYINLVVSSVLNNFTYGAILAIFVLILFLKDYRPTIIIALSIPISLLFAIVLMYFSNVTLNIISLSGLALGVGMLVDNSVVVVENIYRLRKEGVGVIEASIDGARQMSGAIVASTLTTVCVFLPIVFTTGLAKQLFVDMGLTIAYSLFASLIVALTLVPMLASITLKKEKTYSERFFIHLQNIYIKTLKWSLKHKAIVIVSVLVLLFYTIFQTFNMPMILMEEMASNQLSLSVSFEEELTNDELKDQLTKLSNSLANIEEIDSSSISLSNETSLLNMGHTFQLLVIDDYNMDTLKSKLDETFNDSGITYSLASSSMDISALGGSGITIKVYHDDLDVLYQTSLNVMDQLLKNEGIKEVSIQNQDVVKEFRLTVDKNAAMEKGFTTAQIFQEINKLTSLEEKSINVSIDNYDYQVFIIKGNENLTEEEVLNHVIETDDGSFAIKDVVKSGYQDSLGSITRTNSQRYTTITASIKSDSNISLVSREVQENMDYSTIDPNVTLEFDGENESIMETMISILQMIALAICFIYMIMVAQFQSVLSPFIVMFTIPLAFTGGLLAIQLFNMPLSITSMIGFLVLCGVVVNNGIVFIDYTNKLKEEGYTTYDALVETGKVRLRPILMTAMTTILAMTTMALGIGDGAEMMQGMAIVTIGGLLYATILTLFIVPILYQITHKNKLK